MSLHEVSIRDSCVGTQGDIWIVPKAHSSALHPFSSDAFFSQLPTSEDDDFFHAPPPPGSVDTACEANLIMLPVRAPFCPKTAFLALSSDCTVR